jgi:hypothetical protein
VNTFSACKITDSGRNVGKRIVSFFSTTQAAIYPLLEPEQTILRFTAQFFLKPKSQRSLKKNHPSRRRISNQPVNPNYQSNLSIPTINPNYQSNLSIPTVNPNCQKNRQSNLSIPTVNRTCQSQLSKKLSIPTVQKNCQSQPQRKPVHPNRQENPCADVHGRRELAFEKRLTSHYRQVFFHCQLVSVLPFLCYFLWESKESKRQTSTSTPQP